MNSGKKKILPPGWREALKQDLNVLEKMERMIFEDSAWGEQSILSHLSFHFAWIRDGVGYLLFMDLGDSAELLRIGILPEHRKTGEAEAALKALCKSFGKVILEVSNANVPALSLYRKSGFRQSGLRKSYYAPNEDAILMEWP